MSFYGKMTKEHKKKISLSLSGRKRPWVSKLNSLKIGNLNPNWKGNPRENCICKCGNKKSYYSKLCRSCHNLMLRGSKHYLWQGGQSLYNSIRKLKEYKEWRKLIYKQDRYTCNACGQSISNELNVHHIISFNSILNDFLSQYNQFSPIEDVETLTRLATSYKPFWDINNGVTLCKRCHRKRHLQIRNTLN